jgi:hypothetical protein
MNSRTLASMCLALLLSVLLGQRLGAEGQSVPPKEPGPEWTRFIEEVRRRALEYTNALPDFICLERIKRYASTARGENSFLDEIVSEVTFYGRIEHHKLLRVGNKPRQGDEHSGSKRGMTSIGEFGGSLKLLFDPEVGANFFPDGTESVGGRRAARIRYEVARDTSKNLIAAGEYSIVIGYRGHCWVDPDSFEVVRLEDFAVRIPESFPITYAESRTDYGFAEIGGRQYRVPVKAMVRMAAESARAGKSYDIYRPLFGSSASPNYFPRRIEATNVITYEQYRKFGTDVKITY